MRQLNINEKTFEELKEEKTLVNFARVRIESADYGEDAIGFYIDKEFAETLSEGVYKIGENFYLVPAISTINVVGCLCHLEREAEGGETYELNKEKEWRNKYEYCELWEGSEDEAEAEAKEQESKGIKNISVWIDAGEWLTIEEIKPTNATEEIKELEKRIRKNNHTLYKLNKQKEKATEPLEMAKINQEKAIAKWQINEDEKRIEDLRKLKLKEWR